MDWWIQSGPGRTRWTWTVLNASLLASCEMDGISITSLLITKHPVDFATDDIDEWDDPEWMVAYGQPPIIENDILNSEDDAKVDQWLS